MTFGTPPTLEVEIEAHLVRCVKVIGGEVRKLVWDGHNGAPDRMILLPGGRIAYAELKRPKGGRIEPHQAREHRILRRLGFKVGTPRTFDEVEAFVEELATWQNGSPQSR